MMGQKPALKTQNISWAHLNAISQLWQLQLSTSPISQGDDPSDPPITPIYMAVLAYPILYSYSGKSPLEIQIGIGFIKVSMVC